jgi:hypothetical protein
MSLREQIHTRRNSHCLGVSPRVSNTRRNSTENRYAHEVSIDNMEME